jgi:DNA-binding NarL/FixJ family response regulator
MTGDLIRVILADDHAVVRAGLKAVLSSAKDIQVIGEAANGKEAAAMCSRLHPDVVVMDLTMGGGELDGPAATKAIGSSNGDTRVLILTMHVEDDYLVPLLEAGASGYLMKNAADKELVDAVRTVARGELYVRPTAARVLARGLKKKDDADSDRARFEKLTDREKDVLRLTAHGYSAPEIGEKLFISPKTVDTYKQRINEKLGMSHRADYVKLALKLGLLVAE